MIWCYDPSVEHIVDIYDIIRQISFTHLLFPEKCDQLGL